MLTVRAMLADRFEHSSSRANQFAVLSIPFFIAEGLAPLLHAILRVVQRNWMRGGTMTAAAIKQQLDGSTQNHLDAVLDKELDRLEQRVAETAEFRFFITDSARGFLLLNASEQHCDARRLKLTIEHLIVYPLANLFATDRIQVGDRIRIDRDQDQLRLNFIREVEEFAPPVRYLEPLAIPGLFP
jgi:hypothetical protein